MNDIEISCLPKNLPEYIEVDISELELNAMLSLTDIKLPKGVEITALAQGPENDQGIVSIHVIKEVVIEEEEEIVEGEEGEEGEEREEGEGAADEAAPEASGDESSDE
jgi:large subunit ribosomal protein L25